ncbi:hypothetical protein BC833DRAFT_567605 [Globomyces pollinis-pini]|nr:hypothetical protein BC833DRAFT_567605 [Globomyces pollinis-pini]
MNGRVPDYKPVTPSPLRNSTIRVSSVGSASTHSDPSSPTMPSMMSSTTSSLSYSPSLVHIPPYSAPYTRLPVGYPPNSSGSHTGEFRHYDNGPNYCIPSPSNLTIHQPQTSLDENNSHRQQSFPIQRNSDLIDQILNGTCTGQIPKKLYYFSDENGMQELIKLIYTKILEINKPLQVICPYNAQTSEEINLAVHDTVIITSHDFKGYCFGYNQTRNTTGKFPLNCLPISIKLQTKIHLVFYSTTIESALDFPQVLHYCSTMFSRWFAYSMLRFISIDSLVVDVNDCFVVYGNDDELVSRLLSVTQSSRIFRIEHSY